MIKEKKLLTDDRLREIVDELHDEIMIYDNNYRLVYVNKASVRHYGKTPEELIGSDFSSLDEVFWGNSTLPEVYKKKKTVARRQITNKGYDVLTISVPVFDEEGNIAYVAQSVNDVYDKNQEDNIEKQDVIIYEKAPEASSNYIYKSRKMADIMEFAGRISHVSSPCLIMGETGTGKSLLAKHIHETGPRKGKPFVVVNCACMNPNLIESELFGYQKGAFSGANQKGKRGIVEIADKGTLFLDEISELPFDLQGKLLYFIQEKKFLPLGSETEKSVDVNIITATNKDLKLLVENHSFRQDLYYRLNIFEIIIPPLRERTEDINVLAQYYMDFYNKKYRRNIKMMPGVMEVFLRYGWPGNIRELSHTIERLVVLNTGGLIHTENLPQEMFKLRENNVSSLTEKKSAANRLSGETGFFDGNDGTEIHLPEEIKDFPAGEYTQSKSMLDLIDTDSLTLEAAVDELKRRMVTQAYEKTGTSVETARLLGISQPTASRLIREYIRRA